MHTIGVLSSGVTKTFLHIAKAISAGEVPNSRVSIVICDQPNAPIIDVAQELGISNHYIPRQRSGFDVQACKLLKKSNVDVVLLIGYLSKIGSPLLDAFPNKILNGHSGPLPRFGGKGMMYDKTQAAVLATETQYSGPTVHLVDAEYDHGQILGHWPVKVRANDTPTSLDVRCMLAGRQLYVTVLRDFIYRLDRPEMFG